MLNAGSAERFPQAAPILAQLTITTFGWVKSQEFSSIAMIEAGLSACHFPLAMQMPPESRYTIQASPFVVTRRNQQYP